MRTMIAILGIISFIGFCSIALVAEETGADKSAVKPAETNGLSATLGARAAATTTAVTDTKPVPTIDAKDIHKDKPAEKADEKAKAADNKPALDDKTSIQVEYFPIRWEPNSKATHYRIVLSKDENMKESIPYEGKQYIEIKQNPDGTFKYDPPQVDNTTGTIYRLRGLKDALYYVQIRAYRNNDVIEIYNTLEITVGHKLTASGEERGTVGVGGAERFVVVSSVNNTDNEYYNMYYDVDSNRYYIPTTHSVQPKNPKDEGGVFKYDVNTSTFVNIDKTDYWVEIPPNVSKSGEIINFGNVLIYTEGAHTIEHKLFNESLNEFEYKIRKCWADGTAPKLSVHFPEGDVIKIGDIYYTKKDISFTIDARDDDLGSGIQSIYYSFDDINYTKYDRKAETPYTINKSGLTNMYAYAVDNVGNVSMRYFLNLNILDESTDEGKGMKPVIDGLRGLIADIFQDADDPTIYYTSTSNSFHIQTHSPYGEVKKVRFTIYNKDSEIMLQGFNDPYRPIIVHDRGAYKLQVIITDQLGLSTEGIYTLVVE